MTSSSSLVSIPARSKKPTPTMIPAVPSAPVVMRDIKNISANTTIQLAVPDELRGRVISVYTTVFVGSTPLGGLLMGWIASAYGVPASLAVAGIGSLVAGVAALAGSPRMLARTAPPASVVPFEDSR